jgi:tight adherence protein B
MRAWLNARRRVAQLGRERARDWTPETRRRLAAAVAIGVVFLAFGAAGVVVGGIGVGVGLVWWTRRRAQRAEGLRQRQLPEALERIAGALRSGSSTSQAVAEAGRSVAEPLGGELAAMARAMRHGGSLVAIVDAWAAGRRDHGTRLVATALVLASTIGAAPARALDGVAATLRERLELGDERHALATQARISALVLSVAPIAFAVLLALSDPAIAHFLLATTAGWFCLAVGCGLDALGAIWMSRLTRGGSQ